MYRVSMVIWWERLVFVKLDTLKNDSAVSADEMFDWLIDVFYPLPSNQFPINMHITSIKAKFSSADQNK